MLLQKTRVFGTQGLYEIGHAMVRWTIKIENCLVIWMVEDKASLSFEMRKNFYI